LFRNQSRAVLLLIMNMQLLYHTSSYGCTGFWASWNNYRAKKYNIAQKSCNIIMTSALAFSCCRSFDYGERHVAVFSPTNKADRSWLYHNSVLVLCTW